MLARRVRPSRAVVLDDPLFSVAAVFPLVLGGVGLAFVWRAMRERTPVELESAVLAALSDQEALPLATVCERLGSGVGHPAAVGSTLEHLRQTGRAVRWFGDDARPLYRRVMRRPSRS